MLDTPSDYRKSLAALVVAMFSMAMGVGFIVPLLPVYADTLGASGVWIGAIFGAHPFFRAALMLVFGSLADYRSKKSLMSCGLAGYLLVALGFVLVTRVYHLFLLRIMQGVFSAMISPVARAYAGELSPAHSEGRVMGTLNAGFFAGFAAGPLIGGVFADRFGINVPFYAMAAMSGLSLLMLTILVPDQKAHRRHRPGNSRQLILESFRLLRSDVVKGIISIRSSVGMGRGIFSALLPLFGHLVLGLSSSQVGLVVTVRALTSAALQRVGGQLADRFNRKWLAIIGFAMAPLAFLLVPISVHLWRLLMVSVLLGVSTAVSVPATDAIAVEQGRIFSMGRMMGMAEMWRSFAMAIGSVTGGFALDVLGMRQAFVVAALVSALGILGSSWFLRAYRPPAPLPGDE